PASRKPLIFGGVAAAIAIGIAIFFAMKEPEFVKPPETKEARAQRLNALLTNMSRPLRDTVTKAGSTYTDLYTRFIGGKMDDGDNWKKSVFKTMSKTAKETADGWDKQVGTWREAKGKLGTGKAAEIKDRLAPVYDENIAKLGEFSGKMRKIHTDIESTIKTRTKFEKQIVDGKKKAAEDAERLIADYARSLKTLFDKGEYTDWLDLEEKVRSAELDEIVKELLGRKVDRFTLIDAKAVDAILKKHAPRTKKDAPRGIQLVDQAVRTIDGRRTQLINKVTKLLGGEPSHTSYGEAQKAVSEFLASLPAGFEAKQEMAPQVVAALKRAREAADNLVAMTKKGYEDFQDREYRTDRKVYFNLARKLWNPEEGYLQRFDFKEARTQVEMADAMLKVGSYKQLAAQWPPLIDALEKLFARIVADESKWVTDDFMGVDKKGKPKKLRIRGISAEGVKWSKDVVPFHRSSPRWLLDNLFFFEGKPRLPDCTPADHAALGLLAELAGRYEIASAQYQAAATAEGDLSNAVRARLTRLGKEREAAEKFFAILAFARETETWTTPFEEQVRALDEDPDAFDKAARERLETEKGEREQRMAQMRVNLDELNERADLARTMWGSCMRESIHKRAAYAGESIPDRPVKKDGPVKDGGGKKDGDAKKNGDGGDGGR
ncbi:MAG: hypothetical protein P1V36_03910, partial [Planctomycetota bacterium]|nr:hypothetical protein [Planctomycetota bacterium]